jgi:hypothetical protein
MEALMSASSDILAPVVVLNAPRLNGQLITYARAIYGALLDNPNFPNPTPKLSTFAEDIAAFEDAERSNPAVSAKNGDVSGRVMLAAKAVAHSAVYLWEYSVDQSKWTSLPETMKSRTEVSGLTPACVYYFRFYAITRAGRQDYSHVVSLIVR